MIKMIKDAVNPDIFNKYMKDLSFNNFDTEKNVVFFNVPNVEYMQELEGNVMIFKFYEIAFSHTFAKIYPGIKLNYLLSPIKKK